MITLTLTEEQYSQLLDAHDLTNSYFPSVDHAALDEALRRTERDRHRLSR